MVQIPTVNFEKKLILLIRNRFFILFEDSNITNRFELGERVTYLTNSNK